jgi:hypothetical protein
VSSFTIIDVEDYAASEKWPQVKKKDFLTGYTYRCITKHLKIKSFPTPQRYALKATFVGDSYTVAIAIIYLGDNRFLQHKNTKRQYSSAIL